jgi:hypothetical protein
VFDAIPEEIRIKLDEQFTRQGLGADGSVRQALEKYEGLFAMSRYPFEMGSDISKYPPERLLRLVDFLSAFVADLPTTEEPH